MRVAGIDGKIGRRRAAGAVGVEDENVGNEAPRLDSLLQEGEVDEAKLPLRFDLHGELQVRRIDGDGGGTTEGVLGSSGGRRERESRGKRSR